MRKATHLAAEAWRQHYGQTATNRSAVTAAKADFRLPGGEVVTLPGWAQRKQTTANGVECVQPEGEELDSLTYASEALKAAPGHAGQRSDALKAMSNLLSDIQEDHSLEMLPVDSPGGGGCRAEKQRCR